MLKDAKVVVFDDMSQCTQAEVERLLPLVNKQRREQALRYKHVFGQYCCLKSWEILSQWIGCGDWQYNDNGKPFVENGPYFSISHCKQGIVVAVADEPIGVDIEEIRNVDDALIERVLSKTERFALQATVNGEMARDRAFTRLWTQKEAVLKAQGTGIQSFEQVQTILEKNEWLLQTIEKEKYIYSIAYGKLHCIGTQVPPADF